MSQRIRRFNGAAVFTAEMGRRPARSDWRRSSFNGAAVFTAEMGSAFTVTMAA